MKKLAKNWKQRLTKSYSSLSILANILVALSISGLSVLGVISNVIAIPLLVGLAITFGLVGLAGRVIDQGIEDIEDAE
jgi:predicted membrane metal-binding protein